MNAGASLDSLRRIATPEGCEIDLHVAGPVARARAWLVDFVICLSVWLLLLIAVANLGDFGIGLLLFAAFLIESVLKNLTS